jgi:hypothetical protein
VVASERQKHVPDSMNVKYYGFVVLSKDDILETGDEKCVMLSYLAADKR